MKSNKLIDILGDKKKVDDLNKDYHYRQSVLPRLEELKNKIYLNTSEDTPDVERDMDLMGFIIEDLKNSNKFKYDKILIDKNVSKLSIIGVLVVPYKLLKTLAYSKNSSLLINLSNSWFVTKK